MGSFSLLPSLLPRRRTFFAISYYYFSVSKVGLSSFDSTPPPDGLNPFYPSSYRDVLLTKPNNLGNASLSESLKPPSRQKGGRAIDTIPHSFPFHIQYIERWGLAEIGNPLFVSTSLLDSHSVSNPKIQLKLISQTHFAAGSSRRGGRGRWRDDTNSNQTDGTVISPFLFSILTHAQQQTTGYKLLDTRS